MNNQPLHRSTSEQRPCPGDRARPRALSGAPRARLSASLSKIAFILLSVFLILANPVSAAPILSTPKPGDQWTIEILPEADRTATPSADSKKRPKAPATKGTPVERNRLGKDFREQATLNPDGSEAALRVITGSLVIAKVDESEKFALDTLHDEMPGGRPVWNRLTEFSWVGTENRKGRMIVDGVECHIHAEFEEGKSERPIHLAAISVEDGKPLRLESPYEIRRYVWSRGTPSPMPAAALEVLQEFLAEMKRQIQRHNVPR
jgi:hypothetical protein